MRLQAAILSLVAFGACNGGGGGGQRTSSDIRLDAAGDPPDGIDSEDKRMCVAPNGDIYVVWADDRDGRSDIYLTSSVDKGRTWISPSRVNQGVISMSYHPDVGCADDGVYVVWEDDRDGEIRNRNIYFNRSFDKGTNWAFEDVRLDPDEDGRGMSYGPRIAVQGGDIVVVWYDNVQGSFDIYAVASNNAGDVFTQAPARLDSTSAAGSAYSSAPKIAMTPARQVYTVWEDTRNGLSDIYFARSLDGGFSWDQDQRIDIGDAPGQYSSFAPSIGADGDNVYVAWHDERFGVARDAMMIYSDNAGRGWQLEASRIEVDNPGFSESLFPVVAVVGNVGHFAWQDRKGQSFGTYYRRAIGGNWTADDVRLTETAEGTSNAINTTIAAAGDQVVVAWEDRRSDSEGKNFNDIYYGYSLDGGATFAPANERIDNMDEGVAYKVEIDIALHAGEIFASWVDGRAGSSDVYFNHVTIGESTEYVQVSQ